jgi:hypothetical protein
VITALVARDLIIASRIAEAAARAGVKLQRFDDPSDLPPPSEISLLLVDWGTRRPDWGKQLAEWKALAGIHGPPRVILFGPHVDLGAHADARAAGLGPMWARSKLLTELPSLLR